MNFIKKNWLVLIAIVIAVVAIYIASNSVKTIESLGASGTRFPNGLSTTSTSPSSGQVRTATLVTTGDAVFGGGDEGIVVTTSNTATSSIEVGCWQFYATSTATPLKYQASTTPGIMYSQYGTCP